MRWMQSALSLIDLRVLKNDVTKIYPVYLIKDLTHFLIFSIAYTISKTILSNRSPKIYSISSKQNMLLMDIQWPTYYFAWFGLADKFEWNEFELHFRNKLESKKSKNNNLQL